mmetsp:Transcript_115237/g.229582  ORF Transcript_115237/g.229582 Transcript_115237/m.229582 type:complete len:192 (+) Transcript_115237:43-618(+)
MECSNAAKLRKQLQPQHGLKRLWLELDCTVELRGCEGLRRLLIVLPQSLLRVADLERHIRALLAAAVSLPPLVLAVDGFTLPSQAQVAEVVRDGELVVVRKAVSVKSADVAMGDCNQPTAMVTSAEAVYAARSAIACRSNVNSRSCKKDPQMVDTVKSDSVSSLLAAAKAAALEEADRLMKTCEESSNRQC